MPFPNVLAQAAELENLRVVYERATPRQRFKVALSRINNPAADANDLVTRVSAVEAYARALVASCGSREETELIAKHP